jgi:4'-phosphopantetheinyl transferase
MRNASCSVVDIWRIDLTLSEEEIRLGRPWLSPDELRRAGRYAFEKDRRRFVVARMALRQILSTYLPAAPEGLVFAYGAHGKPELAGGLEDSELRFNLSHSAAIAVLAVARRAMLGVDIERIDGKLAAGEIAKRFFASAEAKTLQSLPPAERTKAFFASWTRKEAYLKAIGEGLSLPLHSFEVALRPGEPAALLHVPSKPKEVFRWSLYDIEVDEEYQSALAIEGQGHQLRFLRWQPPCEIRESLSHAVWHERVRE